jgi:signal transduction histidine kinase
MKPPDELLPGKDEPPLKSRLEEARRIIAEYAADLREIIKKLRRHLN